MRLLVTPKWVALTVVLLVAIGGFGWLGSWQWSRVHQQAAPESVVQQGQPVELESLYAPGEPVPDGAVGRPVSLTGEYDAANQLLVPNRVNAGRSGLWVLTPLVLSGGAVVPVVRGWVAQPAPDDGSLSPPGGSVDVTGWLTGPESDGLRAQAPDVLPDGQIAIVSSAELISLWEGELYQGFVLLEGQQPASDLATVDPPALATVEGLSWQSLAYAVQWWLFAAFAIFFWWRMLQSDLAERAGDGSPPPSPDLTEARS